MIDVSTSPTDDSKPIDIYAIGFEEMVDLDAKNILNASAENAKGWASELTKILNRDEKFVLLTYLQLVSVTIYIIHYIYIKFWGGDMDIYPKVTIQTKNKLQIHYFFSGRSLLVCFC